MPEAAAAGPRGDGTAPAATRLHADEHRALPVAEGLILDLPRQAHRLRHRLVIFDELDLAAARPAIDHRGAGGNAEDELLVERGADGRPWKFADQRLRRAEDAPALTADILAIDEEARVAARDLRQGMVDRIEHARRLWGTGRLDGWLLGEAKHVLQVTVTARQRFALHLLIDLDDLRPGLFLEALDVLFREPPHLDEAVPRVGDRIARLLGLVDLCALAIAIDVGAAGVCVEQADLQVEQGRALGTNLLGQGARGFIERDRIAAVHLDGFGTTSTRPADQAPAPLTPGVPH